MIQVLMKFLLQLIEDVKAIQFSFSYWWTRSKLKGPEDQKLRPYNLFNALSNASE